MPRTSSPPTWTAPPSATCCRCSSSSSRRCRPWRWTLRPSPFLNKPAATMPAAMPSPPGTVELMAGIVFQSLALEVPRQVVMRGGGGGGGMQAVLQGDNRDLAIMLDDSGEAAPMAILPACQA